jgi:hypothetical protein
MMLGFMLGLAAFPVCYQDWWYMAVLLGVVWLKILVTKPP